MTDPFADLLDGGGVTPMAGSELREADEYGEAPARLRLHSVEDVLARPPPRWLIEEVIPDDSFVVLYGPSEQFKTFVALDVALHCAAGKTWHGREIAEPGPVVYVSPEGFGALGKRVRAWLVHHELEAEDLARFKLVDVPVGPEQVSHFLAAVKSEIDGTENRWPAPGLIVFDTLAKCMVGWDENATKDMGVFIDGVDRIRREFDA